VGMHCGNVLWECIVGQLMAEVLGWHAAGQFSHACLVCTVQVSGVFCEQVCVGACVLTLSYHAMLFCAVLCQCGSCTLVRRPSSGCNTLDSSLRQLCCRTCDQSYHQVRVGPSPAKVFGVDMGGRHGFGTARCRAGVEHRC
jgi:hypothetical protein